MGPRRGDGAEIAVIKMVDYTKESAPAEDNKSKDAE
jgi:hypothetical protein